MGPARVHAHEASSSLIRCDVPVALTVRVYQAEDKAKWEAYVASSASSTLYHRIGWKAVIERSFGHRTYYLLTVDEQGAVAGVLPLVHLNSLLFGSFLVSLPYCTYGGLCADGEEPRTLLLNEAIAIARREKAAHVELRHTQRLDDGLPVKTEKVSMRLTLPGDPDELWRSLGSKLRSQVKRPHKEGLHVEIGGLDQLGGFYRVFSINMRDLGTPVYPRRFFENILNEFHDATWICTVYRGREPVASGLLAGFKDRLEIPWASSVRRYNRYSPNMLLYWSALTFACERGYTVFDFGRSTPGEGTYRFKEQWGAKPVQLYWHYWLRVAGSLPALNPHNPKYRLAIRLWQRLPVALTRLVGPAIVRSLP